MNLYESIKESYDEFDYGIKEVSNEELSDYVNAWCEHRELPIKADRLISTGGDDVIPGVGGSGVIVAVDNRSGNCWVEEFDSKDRAIAWLNDEFEIGDTIEEGEETEAGNDIDEICAIVYKDCDGDINRFPDKDAMDYIADVTPKEYKIIKQKVTQAINNVADNFYNGYIELSNNATINELRGNFDDVDPDQVMQEYSSIVNSAFAQFEADTGVEIWQDGRMGRHIIVEDNFNNAYNYNDLCNKQEELEEWVIDELEKAYPEKSSDTIEDSESLNEGATKEQVNKYLKSKIGYTEDKEIDALRDEYMKVIKPTEINEDDFCSSVYAWFFDGSNDAKFYDEWLKKNWKEEE